MSHSTTNGILLLAVCTVFVFMPHGTVSSGCTQSSVCDGGWSAWNNWTSDGNCITTCSVCTQSQTRLRTCTNPIPQNGGKPCNGTSRESKIIACDVITCPLVDGGWGAWYAWTASSSCSASCGGGTLNQVRTRPCSNPWPNNGGKDCNGSLSESQTVDCNTHPCTAVDAIWSDWTTWFSNGRWNVTCSIGKQTQTRTRSCSIPQNCGRNCEGDSTVSQIVQCNKQTCPPECPSTGNVTNCSISSISMTKTVQTPISGESGCTSLNCICDEIFHGYIRYPTNCTKFIQCAFNKSSVSSCESGTNWNQKLQICDQSTC